MKLYNVSIKTEYKANHPLRAPHSNPSLIENHHLVHTTINQTLLYNHTASRYIEESIGIIISLYHLFNILTPVILLQSIFECLAEG